MAATKKKKVSINIPLDLVFNILSKLPVKSLKRFICVDKSWADLFENPNFMTMYRNNFLSSHDNDNSCVLLKQSLSDTQHDSLFLLSGESFENKVKLEWPPPFQEDDDNIDRPPPFEEEEEEEEEEEVDDNIFILGSAINGTICVYQSTGCDGEQVDDDDNEIMQKVVLWNPTTEEFKIIPSGPIDCQLGISIMVELHGFGYDSVADDYKVIRRFCFVVNDFWEGIVEIYPYVPMPSWQIYSLKTNSWKKLDIDMPCNASSGEVYLNGVCHWWGPRQSEQLELVSFNFSDEVFHSTYTPLDWNDCYSLWNKALVVLNNAIGIITAYKGSTSTCFDISILGELGVSESWTKLFTIGPLPCVSCPLGVWNRGGIFFKKNGGKLAWFNLSTQMVTEIGSCCQLVIYKESLLPIGGINS